MQITANILVKEYTHSLVWYLTKAFEKKKKSHKVKEVRSTLAEFKCFDLSTWFEFQKLQQDLWPI